MNFLNKKINRFLYPLLWIAILSIILVGALSFGDPDFLLITLIVTLITIVFYLLFALISLWLIRNDLLAITASLSITYFTLYKIFRIMHWPGTLIFLSLGMLLGLAALVFVFMDRSGERK